MELGIGRPGHWADGPGPLDAPSSLPVERPRHDWPRELTAAELPPPHLLLRLWEFSTALIAARDFEAAAALFRGELGLFGIDGYACGEVDLNDPSRTIMLHAEWPADWLDFYIGEKLHESDPLLPKLGSAAAPFTWDETWETLGARRWRQAVLSYGWRSGLAVPLRRGSGRVGLISLTSKHDALSADENRLLATLAGLFYERARGLGVGEPPAVVPALTVREIACLQGVAAGLDDAGIGMKVGIAASTAHEHVERAKRKLKARTRAQAVALAIGAGLFSP
jgi:DNA-binding CsgD family transcriptional regulator